MLTDKAVNGDQTLTNGVDRNEKTFESDSAEERWTSGSDEAWSGDFLAVESQLGFGDGPDIALSASDHDALRTGGIQRELFRQRARYDAERRTSIDEEFDLFDIPGRAGQLSLYVKKSHGESFFMKVVIVAQPANNASAPTVGRRQELRR